MCCVIRFSYVVESFQFWHMYGVGDGRVLQRFEECLDDKVVACVYVLEFL